MDIQQRYIPATGWAAGRYTFTMTLETVNPASGPATVVIELPVETEIIVP
ncbi:MAG: hypothetical protein ACR2OE_14430 [Thermomicrobiales bacterium]